MAPTAICGYLARGGLCCGPRRVGRDLQVGLLPYSLDGATSMPDDSRLDRLVTYTTFHIGVYVTLAAAALTVAEKLPAMFPGWALGCSIVLLVVAGAAGGTIASNAVWSDSWTQFNSD